jgi:hypothetical protein
MASAYKPHSAKDFWTRAGASHRRLANFLIGKVLRGTHRGPPMPREVSEGRALRPTAVRGKGRVSYLIGKVLRPAACGAPAEGRRCRER